ncbi:MAG TPA: phosphatase PAP2 family protein [Syntrophales bacterium]|nr:phosphatase PAP2 family protein [Syntrophales bacterium]
MRRFRQILSVAAFFVFLLSPVLAERGHFISLGQVDLVKILAPPPANDSPQTQAEIQELIFIQDKRTAQEEAAAKADERLTIFQIAGDILGPKFTPDNLPITVKFFERLGKDEGFIVNHAKETWNRPRPFMLSEKVRPCVRQFKSGAYPSGHATYGYLCGIVLANMVPEKKEEIFARACQYGYHRMVGGVHYRSDVEAGRISGTVIAAIMMQNPNFQEEFSRARSEVRIILQLP